MSKTIVVEIEQSGDYNAVAVSVAHVRKQVALVFYPAIKNEDGSVSTVLDQTLVRLADMPRLNNKVVQAYTELSKKEIEEKSGTAYNALREYAKNKNFVLK